MQQKVIALKYKKEEDIAPKVVAKGKGYIADKIIKIAREHNIPIYEDKLLVESLYKLELESYIPEELYEAVAKVLAFVYNLKKGNSA